MSSWSQRRKFLFITFFLIIFVIVVGYPVYRTFQRFPTCSDGIKNQSEQGIDCGGVCVRLCQTEFLPASIEWTRFEKVANGLYNVAAYIVNPNPSAEAPRASYTVSLYDDRGILILEEPGMVTLPPHRNTLAFQPALDVGKRIPAKALFEFTSAPEWRQRGDPLQDIQVIAKEYSEDESGSSLIVTLRNASLKPLYNVVVYVILYDSNGNALGFSRTVIDEIKGEAESTAPFTWPVNREGKVISIEILPVAE